MRALMAPIPTPLTKARRVTPRALRIDASQYLARFHGTPEDVDIFFETLPGTVSRAAYSMYTSATSACGQDELVWVLVCQGLNPLRQLHSRLTLEPTLSASVAASLP